jgi:hypothetical protein
MKSAGAAFRNHLAECMKHLCWKLCRADQYIWMKAETRHDDGMFYWAYILDEYFKMKKGSIQVPTFYLGVKLKKTVLTNCVVAWGMSSSKYLQSPVKNVQ